MFGYVTICEPELKVKDLKKYKAYYCGLCHVLKEQYGWVGQMTLTYDMTFAVIFLSSLYEFTADTEFHRCSVHPVRRQTILTNRITSYAAAMNVLLAYYHMKDDWKDERKISGFAGIKMMRKKAERIRQKYPRQSRGIEEALISLSVCEKEKSTDIDRVSACFGHLMEELFLYREDVWKDTLKRMGFFLGKFIYIMDAYEDLPEDMKKQRYNPLRDICRKPDFEDRIKQILCMMIAESTAEFEKLPCLQDVDILRNILYDGVWSRYNRIQVKKREEIKDDKKSI